MTGPHCVLTYAQKLYWMKMLASEAHYVFGWYICTYSLENKHLCLWLNIAD